MLEVNMPEVKMPDLKRYPHLILFAYFNPIPYKLAYSHTALYLVYMHTHFCQHSRPRSCTMG